MNFENRTLLAIDTTTELCSVALSYKGELYSDAIEASRDHASCILPMLDRLLSQVSISLNDLDVLIYARGPGSFTGVRICLGIAQGLAYGANLPMVGVSTLAALAEQTFRILGKKSVYCALDARMNEIYYSGFTRMDDGCWQVIVPEQVMKPELLDLSTTSDVTFAGTGWHSYQEKYADLEQIQENRTAILYPMAEDLIRLFTNANARLPLSYLTETTAELAEPVYLRNEVTWQKLPGRG